VSRSTGSSTGNSTGNVRDVVVGNNAGSGGNISVKDSRFNRPCLRRLVPGLGGAAPALSTKEKHSSALQQHRQDLTAFRVGIWTRQVIADWRWGLSSITQGLIALCIAPLRLFYAFPSPDCNS